MKYQGSNSITYLITLIKGALGKKVDKVDGKGLSTNDLTNALKSNYDAAYTHSQAAHAPSNAQANIIEKVNVDGKALTITNKAVNIDLSGKVDKVDGKGLSTNDYTTEEKTKLAGIATGANKTIINNTLTSTSSTEALAAAQGKALNDKITSINTTLGDLNNDAMLKSVYDTDGDGIVDNAEKVNGHTVASDVPANAKFTDTTYIPATTATNGLMSSGDKSKLDGIAAGAQVNVIETIKVNGTAQTVTSKGVNISVPTNNNQLTNGAGYQTSAQVESAITSKGYQTATQVNTAITSKGYQTSSQVQTAINNALKDVTSFEFTVVNALPETGVKGTIYLMAHAHGTGDGYDEYIWVTDKYEKIGNTDIDLSGYLLKSDAVEMTNQEVQAAWDNVMNA